MLYQRLMFLPREEMSTLGGPGTSLPGLMVETLLQCRLAARKNTALDASPFIL